MRDRSKRGVIPMLYNDLQFLKAWTLRNDEGFTWWSDAWGVV
jgi:hypothetical protein